MSHQNIKWTLHVCRNDTILWVVENEKYELLQFSSQVKIVEKLDSKRENSDSCRRSVRTCTLGRGTARAAQSPTPASSTRWRPASTSPPSCSPSLVLSTSYIAHHFCFPSPGILGNFVSVYVLSRSDCTRFGNLLIMLAYMDIR